LKLRYSPIYRERQLRWHAGGAIYPLETLLANQVPGGSRKIQGRDRRRQRYVRYATKTNIEGNSDLATSFHSIRPVRGLLLRVTSYKHAGQSLQRLLVVAIFLLAAGVFWSLWLVRDLMKKRSDAEEACAPNTPSVPPWRTH
jgi:two-component system sensor histidine kinase DctS